MADELQTQVANGKKKSRSPTYPVVPLKKAIERAKQLYDKEGKHGARFDVIAGHWGYKATSSGAMQTVATLRQFGLISFESGVAESRIVKLTELAIRILLDEREPEHTQAIQRAALMPKLYAGLWTKYGRDLPSDASVLSHLKVDLDFNPAIAEAVLRDYKETIGYAKPPQGASLSDDPEDTEGSLDEEPEEMEAAISTHVRPQKTNEKPLLIDEEEVHLHTKLLGGRSVRVLFNGPPPTRREIEKLIKLLEEQKDQYPTDPTPPTS